MTIFVSSNDPARDYEQNRYADLAAWENFGQLDETHPSRTEASAKARQHRPVTGLMFLILLAVTAMAVEAATIVIFG